MRCRLLLRAPFKSSDFDVIPTSLVKDCIDNLITLSLTEGSFPSHFKSDHVTRPFEKTFIDKDSMNKYRPVSNIITTILWHQWMLAISQH